MALVPSGGGPDPNPDAPCRPTTIPWSEMFRSTSVLRPKQQEEATPPPKTPLPTATKKAVEDDVAGLLLYIAMVHAGMATALLVLYGLYMLLADFLRPLQWALLCSIPLRETQRALVDFWEPTAMEGPDLDRAFSSPFGFLCFSCL